MFHTEVFYDRLHELDHPFQLMELFSIEVFYKRFDTRNNTFQLL